MHDLATYWLCIAYEESKEAEKKLDKKPTEPKPEDTKKPEEEKKSGCDNFKSDQTVYMMCKMLEQRDKDKAAEKEKKKK